MARASLLSVFALSFLAACQASPTPGASCTSTATCGAPLACRFGRCRAACAADRDCPSGASCLLDVDGVGACSLDTDLGCETGVGRECASGLVCIADRCAQTCSTGMGCATGAVCVPTGTGVFFCAPNGTDASVPPSDAPGSDAIASDAGIAAPCTSIVDIDTRDAGVGALTVHVDTSATPEVGVLPLLSCTTGATRVAHQLAYRYRMRATRFLRVDTGVGETSSLYDTVVALFDACDPMASTLVCDDDYRGDLRARVQSAAPLSAGTEVIIGLGGIEPGAVGDLSSGPLDFSIEEIPSVALGEMCDVTGGTAVCENGACATLRTGVGECRAVVDEMELTSRSHPQLFVLTDAVVVHGSLDANDEDCFAFDVAAGQSVVLTPSNGRGECPRDRFGLQLTLLSATGTIDSITGDDASASCPPLDGTTMGPLHALPAGRYRACLSAPSGLVLDAYDLSISLS